MQRIVNTFFLTENFQLLTSLCTLCFCCCCCCCYICCCCICCPWPLDTTSCVHLFKIFKASTGCIPLAMARKTEREKDRWWSFRSLARTQTIEANSHSVSLLLLLDHLCILHSLTKFLFTRFILISQFN